MIHVYLLPVFPSWVDQHSDEYQDPDQDTDQDQDTEQDPDPIQER